MHKGQGCDGCLNIGYHEREGIYEILEITTMIRNLIVDKASDEQIKAQAIKEGMKTLKAQGISHVLKGTTTLQELSRVVDMREG